MSVGRYHGMCQRGIGRPVQIRTIDGRTHRGIIHRVSANRVYLRPLGRGRNPRGFGYPYYRGYGWGYGFGWGIALGTIATLAFLPFFI